MEDFGLLLVVLPFHLLNNIIILQFGFMFIALDIVVLPDVRHAQVVQYVRNVIQIIIFKLTIIAEIHAVIVQGLSGI